jgi:hypothetical protein
MLTIRVHISFQDCNGVEVYRTATARSKIKEYKAAYKAAIESAFESLDGYTYQYKPAADESPIVVNFGDDVKTLEPEIVTKAEVKEEVTETPTIPETPAIPAKDMVVEESPATVVQGEVAEKAVPSASDDSLWYAQEIPNGFQLVDSSPKVRLRIYQTQKEGVFLAKGEASEGIVYEDRGNWYYDYYLNGKLVHQMLNIKF